MANVEELGADQRFAIDAGRAVNLISPPLLLSLPREVTASSLLVPSFAGILGICLLFVLLFFQENLENNCKGVSLVTEIIIRVRQTGLLWLKYNVKTKNSHHGS